MLLINSVGLYFSQSRASFLAAAVSLALYVSYVVLGRRRLPYAMAGLTGVVLLFVLSMPIVGVTPSGRFSLWAGSIEAFLNDPSLFGAGLITPGEYIAPYVSEPYKGQNPHNSYLVIFLRAGFIGGIAYAGIVVGSLITGVRRNQQVDVSALALAFGFGIHQMFEGYTLFQHEISSIIATLSFGFLILSDLWIETDRVSQ
ncbi:O-antigen ligase family protein [Halocatena marina]|uniref:O-antigen ligase family protein n=3 Tax=Halocatena marina TaxID=2934937 RepID=A0ABD5YP63_9EURY